MDTPKHPDYDRHYAEWRRTLPNAPDAVIHDKVTKHIAFNEQIKDAASTAASKPQLTIPCQFIPCQFVPTKCEFQPPPPPRKTWELRAIIVLLALILISMIAKIAHGEPAPPLPLPFSRVMMLPQAGNVPIPLPIQGSGSSSPVYVICSSGCSAAGAFADNSAFTVGTTPGSILFGYYTSGAAPTLTSGSAARARIDANSYLAVDCVTGCSASAGFADNSAFTAGTTAIGITGGWYAASPTACTTGNACAPSMTSDRKMFVQAFQGTSPWVVSNSGTFAVQAAQSGTWTVTGAGGTFPVTGTFWQTTQPVSGTFWQATQPISAASLPLPTGASTAAKQPALGTAGSASTDVITVQGVASMTKLLVTPDSVALPANQSVNMSQIGGTAVLADPCRANAKVYTLINVTTGTQLITGTSAKKQYICSIQLITATAQNVAIVEGTGTVCATSTLGLLGGASAATGWNFAANGGLTYGNGSSALAATTVNANNVCVLTSSSGQISGNMVSVAQ